MMLTSFFGKSNPINFLLLGVFIMAFCFLTYFLAIDFTFRWDSFIRICITAVILVFSMLLLDFIIRKNYLNTSNTYAIFIFSCMVAMVPVTKHIGIIIAQFLLLLALRRIFSMASEKNLEKKILDASLWILLASYFFFWSILLFGLLYIAILNLTKKPVRYMLIPVTGFFGMILIATAFFFIKDNSFRWIREFAKPISYDFTTYGSIDLMVFITFFFSVLIWSIFYRISKLPDIPKKFRNNYLLVVFSATASFLITLFSEIKIGTELIFLAAPSAITIAGYLEKKGDIWFKELLLWTFLLLPIFFLLV
ncbi:MAG: DUF6427 family protein [Flavobacteriaceae bacterium]